jgi:hypothetical protein
MWNAIEVQLQSGMEQGSTREHEKTTADPSASPQDDNQTYFGPMREVNPASLRLFIDLGAACYGQ